MPLKLGIPSPTLGVNVESPAEFINVRETSNNQNMRTRRGVLETRPGSSALGSSLGERVQRIFELEKIDGGTGLLRIGPTKVQSYDKSAGTWSSIAYTALTGDTQDMIDYAFPILSGARIAVYTNGIDAIRKWTGSGNDGDLGGSPPKAKYMAYFEGYLLLAFITDDGGGNTFPFRVQWSDTGEPETWTPANDNNAGSTDLVQNGAFITGIAVWGNFVTIHTADSIYVGQLVTTSEVFRFDRKSTGVGAVSGKAIATIITGEQIFLASDGIHSFNGITAPLIESPIQQELRDSMNPAVLYKAEAVVKEEDDEVWFAIPMGSSTEPDTIYKFNYRTRQIYKDARTNLTTMGLYLSVDEKAWDDLAGSWDSQSWRWDDRTLANTQPQVAFGFSDGTSLYNDPTTYDDNNAAVTSISDTKDFTCLDFGLDDYATMMRWKEVQLWATGTLVKVEYSTDGGSTWTVIGSLTLSSAYPTDDAPQMLYFDVVSSRLRLRFTKTASGDNFAIKKYYLAASKREVRK